MHPGDAGMLEHGDMFSNRKNANAFLRWIAPPMFGFGKAQRCTPDVPLEDGFSLADYGLVARVIHLPGHSAGSVAVLTAQGDLFCGDLIDNTKATRTQLDHRRRPMRRRQHREIERSVPANDLPRSRRGVRQRRLSSPR